MIQNVLPGYFGRCEGCGANLMRWRSKYCNSRCRQRAYRRRLKIKALEQAPACKKCNSSLYDMAAKVRGVDRKSKKEAAHGKK